MYASPFFAWSLSTATDLLGDRSLAKSQVHKYLYNRIEQNNFPNLFLFHFTAERFRLYIEVRIFCNNNPTFYCILHGDIHFNIGNRAENQGVKLWSYTSSQPKNIQRTKTSFDETNIAFLESTEFPNSDDWISYYGTIYQNSAEFIRVQTNQKYAIASVAYTGFRHLVQWQNNNYIEVKVRFSQDQRKWDK